MNASYMLTRFLNITLIMIIRSFKQNMMKLAAYVVCLRFSCCRSVGFSKSAYFVMVLCLMVLLSFISTSCVGIKSTERRISEKRQKLTDEYTAELEDVKSSSHGGKFEATWGQAIEKMYLQNPNLIQADYRIIDARSRQRQLWRNFVPGITVSASDSFYIRDLSDAFTDTSFRVSSYVSLGNLLDLPKRVYTNKLYFLGAKLQAENSMRQQVIALYRMFQEQRLIKLERRAIKYEREFISGIQDLDGEDLLSMRFKHKEALEKWEEKEKAWRSKVGDFFMGQYGVVNLMAEDLPNISYKPSELDFTDTGRWGFLQLNLLALEEIAEDGNVLDAYMRYLPRANMSVSAPSLYTSYSNTQFDPELIRVGPSLYWSMDSRGYVGQQIDRLKRNKVINDWRKDKRRREEITRLLEGKEALKDVQKELGNLQIAIRGYQKAVKSGLVKDPEMAVKTMRKLRGREVRLKAREIEIYTEFWLIDERRWAPITLRWLETSAERAQLRKKAQKSGVNPLNFLSRDKV